MKRSKFKHSSVLLDLWSSSDEEETSNIFSRELASDTSSSAGSPQGTCPSDNQMRINPSVDTGVIAHQRPNREKEKVGRRDLSSKVHCRPNGWMLEKQKGTEIIDSGKKSSPVFPPARKTVSLTDPRMTLPTKTPTESFGDSTEEDNKVKSECATMKHTQTSNSHRKDRTGRQSRLKQSHNKFGKLEISSSSESNSSDTESRTTRVKEGYPCSRAIIGRQLGREEIHLNSKYNSKLMFGSDSSASSSSSSDSESLLSPRKLKRKHVQRSSRAKVPGKCTQSSSLLQRVSSGLQPSQDLCKLGRCKRGLSRCSNQVPKFKRARVSPFFANENPKSFSSSSSDTESDDGLNIDLSFLNSSKRTAETANWSGDGNKALVSGQQIPSLEKVTRRKMISLFGKTSSEDGQDTIEEDVKELGDEQVGNIKEDQTSAGLVSCTGAKSSLSNHAGLSSSNDIPHGGSYSAATTRKKSDSSERDDSVVLVDITQSTERGALAGQSLSLETAKPSTKLAFGESQDAEELPSVFSKHVHSWKVLPVGHNDGSVLVGNVTRDATQGACSSLKTLKSSHLTHVFKDASVTSSANGTRHLPLSKASSLKQAFAHRSSKSPVIQSESPVFGSQSSVLDPYPSSSGCSTERSKYLSSADKFHGSKSESSELNSHSQGQLSSTSTQDNPHFPRMCFEEERLHCLEDTQGSSHRDRNEATATSDPTESSITIFRRDFFMKSPSTDQPFQSSDARNTSEQFQSSSSIRVDPESPPLVLSLRVQRRNPAADQISSNATTHSFESSKPDFLSLNEDRRQKEMTGDTKVTIGSSSSGLHKKKRGHHEVTKNKRSSHVAQRKTSPTSILGNRSNESYSLTCDSHKHHPQNVEVESYQTSQHINNDRVEPTISSCSNISDPHSDVEVLESHSPHQHSIRLPLKARHKSKHDGSIAGSQDRRPRRRNTKKASTVDSRGREGLASDVLIVESQESRRSVGEPSVRRTSRETEVSGITDSADIDVVELVRQLDEDERMAKQLQETFDAELARLTDEHSRGMSSYTEILPEPVIIPPELPNFVAPPQPLPRPPPLLAPSTQTAHPAVHGFTHHHREMRWRNDLMDMSPINAAMMAEMGRVMGDHTVDQSGYGYRGRQRRGRGRGRGRFRTTGHHHHQEESDGTDYEQLWNLVEQVGSAVSKGLPESSINLLPTFLYTTAGKDATENECSICMGDYEAGENMRRLPCFHFYHAACIDKWLKDNRICPVCREEVNFEAPNFT